MRYFTAAEIDCGADFSRSRRRAGRGLSRRFCRAERHHHEIDLPDGSHATHLADAGLDEERANSSASKIVNCVSRQSASSGLPAVQGTYVLQSAQTGETLALFDGSRLTTWRTAAASALAARYLAREDARKLLIVGSGALAPFLARAHASQRPIDSIEVWNHRPRRARRSSSRR